MDALWPSRSLGRATLSGTTVLGFLLVAGGAVLLLYDKSLT